MLCYIYNDRTCKPYFLSGIIKQNNSVMFEGDIILASRKTLFPEKKEMIFKGLLIVKGFHENSGQSKRY